VRLRDGTRSGSRVAKAKRNELHIVICCLMVGYLGAAKVRAPVMFKLPMEAMVSGPRSKEKERPRRVSPLSALSETTNTIAGYMVTINCSGRFKITQRGSGPSWLGYRYSLSRHLLCQS
jgi:hypothetical protein